MSIFLFFIFCFGVVRWGSVRVVRGPWLAVCCKIQQCIFVCNNIDSTSTQDIFIQRLYSFNFNTGYFHSTTIKITHSTSTLDIFIQRLYSLNFNTGYFYSTTIFIQLQHWIFSLNDYIHSTSTLDILIQRL